MTHPFHGFFSPNSTPVPDELFDELMSSLSGAELKVLLYIIRRTFGFKKHADNISLHQICRGITTRAGDILDRGTGLSLSTVQVALKGLIAKQCVVTVRNTSREKGDLPTTYSLKIRSLTDNQQGGIPKIGNGGYRKSVPQQTATHSTDLQFRNSKANRQQEEHDDQQPLIPIPAIPPHAATTAEKGRSQQPRAEELKPSRTGSLRTLSEILTTHQPAAPAPKVSNTASKLVPTEQLLVAVTEISGDFNDLRNLKSNTSQALHIWQASGRSEAAIISSLYEARSITRHQRDVRYPIRYFWKTVRDLMGLPPALAAAHAPTAGAAAG